MDIRQFEERFMVGLDIALEADAEDDALDADAEEDEEDEDVFVLTTILEF